MSELVRGCVYELHSRNLRAGVYNGRGLFIGIRTRFGDRCLDGEVWHDPPRRRGTARPLRLLGAVPPEMILAEGGSGDDGRWHQNAELFAEMERWEGTL